LLDAKGDMIDFLDAKGDMIDFAPLREIVRVAFCARRRPPRRLPRRTKKPKGQP